MSVSAGIPGLRGTEHIGFTVPDLEQATRWLVEVIGCQFVYEIGPISDGQGDWMSRQLNVAPDACIDKLRFFRCKNGANFEVFQYQAPKQQQTPPRNSDVGGHHIAFYVDDFKAALSYLQQRQVQFLGEPVVRDSGPSAGQTWIYFLSPWGMQFELVSFPQGKGYEHQTALRLWQPAED